MIEEGKKYKKSLSRFALDAVVDSAEIKFPETARHSRSPAQFFRPFFALTGRAVPVAKVKPRSVLNNRNLIARPIIALCQEKWIPPLAC